MSSKRFLAGAILFALSAAQLAAQFTLRSTVSGMVSDATGASVPGAKVILTEVKRNQEEETTTNSAGIYRFANVPHGTYHVSVEQPGFKRALSPEFAAGTQGAFEVNLQLEIGQVSVTADVTATAPILETEQTVIGQTIERELVETLPMKGRNFTGFAALAPNISTFPRGNDSGSWSIGGHHLIGGTDYIAGGGGDNGFYMNGVNINDNWMGSVSYAPSMEAISEIKVDVANFSAANGRDISSFQVSTRGGTNSLHGTGFDYFQNSALNAWDPYTKMMISPDQKKNVLQRNQFGGNLGGPIVIPKIFDGRNKAFFFANYEQTAERRGGESATYRVPTAEERRGDFSHLLRRFPGDPNYVLYDPFSTVIDENGESSRLPLVNNTIPAGMLNADAAAMLDMFPQPNGYSNPADPRDLRNYRTFLGRGQDNYRFDTRVDLRISNNDNVFVNFSKSRGLDRNSGGLFPDLASNVEDSSYMITGNYARVFSPSITNEFIIGYGQGKMVNVDSSVRDYMHQTDTLRNKFFKNIGEGDNLGYHGISIDNWATIGHWEVWNAGNPSFQLSDNLSWIKGKHSFKFGFNYLRKRETGIGYNRGAYFSKQFTQGGSLEEQRGGDAMGDFLFGTATSITQIYKVDPNEVAINQVMPYWGFYAEDKWDVSPKLTVSLGLRYDLPIARYHGNRYGNARINFDVPNWQLEIPGRAQGLPLHWIPADKNNFAPRISVAYRGPKETVIRASYGIFYMAGMTVATGGTMDYAFATVPGMGNDFYDNARFGQPDDVPTLMFSNIFPAEVLIEVGQYPISTGVGTGYFDYPANISTNDRYNVTPYYQRYLFEVQKAVGASSVITATYMGGRGTKLPFYENVNRPAYATGWTSEDALNDARPNNSGRFADARLLRPGLNSFYNAATIKFNRRFSKGLQLVAHYTFSKTVADTAMFKQIGTGDFTPSWQWNRKLGRGEADFSHPHRLVVSGTYSLPQGKEWNKAMRFVAGGWNLSGIYTLESGNALTPFNGVTSARDFEPDMPNLNSNPNLSWGDRTFNRWFNTAAFSTPPQDVKGTAGPGIIRGPGMNNFDISLAKIFSVTERWRVEFRSDFLNALNHTQWRSVDTTFSDTAGSTFGWITGGREGRIVQLGLRVSF